MAENCDTVCKTLTDINNTLITNLVDRITEILQDINTSLEVSGRVDKSMSDELLNLKKCLETQISMSSIAYKNIDDILIGVKELRHCSVVTEDDREKVFSFLRRMSSAVALWPEEERAAVLDVVEHSGKNILSISKKFKKLYWIVMSAGVLTLLTNIGAPAWIQKLVSLLVGGH